MNAREPCGGPEGDHNHANHAMRDVCWRLLRSAAPRKINSFGFWGYLGVKGSQFQILSARPKSPGNSGVSGTVKVKRVDSLIENPSSRCFGGTTVR